MKLALKKEANHKVGIFFMIMAIFEIALVLFPDRLLPVLLNIAPDGIWFILELILVPVTTFGLLHYFSKLLSIKKEDRKTFLLTYLVSALLGLVYFILSERQGDIFEDPIGYTFYLPFYRFIVGIVGILGNVNAEFYQKLRGGIILMYVIALFVMLVFVPLVIGLFYTLFKKWKGKLISKHIKAFYSYFLTSKP